jgi:hypothetical protein
MRQCGDGIRRKGREGQRYMFHNTCGICFTRRAIDAFATLCVTFYFFFTACVPT